MDKEKKPMRENTIRLTHKIIFIGNIIAAVASPLFFLPVTSEFFEINKFTLLLALTIVMAIAWAIRMVLQRKFTYTKTPLDVPLLIFVAIFFVASFSSLDQYVSIFGTGGNVWPSLVSVVTITVFYFTGVSNLRTRKEALTILIALTVSTTLAAVIATISYFGIYWPFDFTHFRAFNTLGSPNRLALLESIVLPLSISWVAFTRDRKTRIAATIASIILLGSLVLTNFTSAYFGLVAAAIVVAANSLKIKVTKPAQIALTFTAIALLVVLAMRFLPPFSQATLEKLIINSNQNSSKVELPTITILPQKTGWDIAASTVAKKPFFGSGPGTYQFVYTKLKPSYVNATPNWLVRFDKSSSEFSELVATTGVLGTIAFVFLVLTLLRFTWGLIFKSPNSFIYVPVGVSIIAGITASFFTTFSVSTITALFISIICLVVLAKTQDEKFVSDMSIEVATLRNSFNWLPAGDKFASLKTFPQDEKMGKSQALPIAFMLLVVAASLYVSFNQFKIYQGEYYFRQSLMFANKNDGGKTIDTLQKAIKANPSVDTYHRSLSQTALLAAINLNKKSDPSADERSLLSQLAQAAIEQGKVASGYQILPLRIPGISANNVANWETLSAAYQAIIGSVQGADINALNTLAQASSLDPQNPILHDQLGLLYQRLKNLDSAQRNYEDSIVVKSDYGPGHYHLAKILIEKNGDITRIANELNLAKKFLPQNDPAIDEINKNLDIYNQKVEQLQKQSASEQQSISDGKASPTPTPTASPSSKTSATPKPSSTPIPSIEPVPSPSL